LGLRRRRDDGQHAPSVRGEVLAVIRSIRRDDLGEAAPADDTQLDEDERLFEIQEVGLF
jgi:hypothetical protein